MPRTPVEKLEYDRKWRAENPDKSVAASRNWRKKNPAYWRQWRADNLESRKRSARRFKLKNPNWMRNRYLERKYGITLTEFNTMLKLQNRRCALCNRPFKFTGLKGGMKSASVDHDHKTGKVRALLHRSCNAMLGIVEDSTANLEKAIAYLKAHQNVRLH